MPPKDSSLPATSMALSSVMSAVLVGCVCTPFDVVKNYVQASKSLEATRESISSLQVVKTIYERKGLRAFWSGLAPALGVVVPSNLIFFPLYEWLKERNRASIAAVKARFFSVILTSPIELARTRIQATLGKEKTMEYLMRVLETEGGYSLWRGVIPTLVRDIPFSAIYWELYEYLKSRIYNSDPAYFSQMNFMNTALLPFSLGIACGSVATVISQPFDVIKTNMQASDRVKKNSYGGYSRIDYSPFYLVDYMKQRGFRSLFVGLTPRLLKVPPSCALMIATFEWSKKTFQGFSIS